MANPWGKRSVSTTESTLSTFGFVYTFLGLYLLANVLLFLNAAREEGLRHDDFERYVTAIARGSGATINFNIAVVLLVASRSTLGFLRETPLNLVLPIDKAMPGFHTMVGVLVVFAGLLHSVMQWVTYSIKRPWADGYNRETSLFVSGMILLVVLVAIRVAARSSVYNSNYEIFFRVHVGGSIIAFITILIHGLHRGDPSTWKWVIGPIVIYLLDVGMRSFREKRSYLLVSKHSAAFQGTDIVKIRLPRVFHFQAGQYAELKVPALSRLQWHPFTIASAPHEPEMVFYIKAVGDWTIYLHQLFSERIREGTGGDIEVHIRGPFGASSQHVGQFDRVILVGGGVGATPFCSVVKNAHNWMTNWTPSVQKEGSTKRTGRSRARPKASGRDDSDGMNVQRSSRETTDASESTKSHTAAGHNSPHTSSQAASSHIVTTNVYTENFESFETNDPVPRGNTIQTVVTRNGDRTWKAPRQNNYRRQRAPDSDLATAAESIMYTARDYLMTTETEYSETTSGSSGENAHKPMPGRLDLPKHSPYEDRIVPTEPGKHMKSTKAPMAQRAKFSGRYSRTSLRPVDPDMGSYHENSSGSHRRSLDYISALHSAYSERQNDEVYQQSLDMMVSLSFGSVSLVRNMQVKKAQRTLQQAAAERLPFTVDKKDLSVFQNPRIMFLLFMRSVTVNMVLLWLLLIRFFIAGFAHVFDGLLLFDEGIALYKSSALIIADLVLSFMLTILVGIPSILEVIELGAAPVHGFDLFVLTPTALFGVISDILALAGVGKDVNLFGVVNVFVLWPILGIFVTIRLLRVIGERIAQAESLSSTHSSTRAVDFYWTAPNPEDDRWLVDELSPYGNLKTVQMYRFLTRCTGPEWDGREEEKIAKSLHTRYGRPDWDAIFNEVAESSKNNSTIGVFFCGPTSMGKEVQMAAMGAMRNSIVRGLHSGARAMRGLEEVFGEAVSANEYTGENADGKTIGLRGCNVKFVFKRESFA